MKLSSKLGATALGVFLLFSMGTTRVVAQELPGVPFDASFVVPPVTPIPPAGGWPTFDATNYMQMQQLNLQQASAQLKSAQKLWLEFQKYKALAQELRGLNPSDWVDVKNLMVQLANAIDNTQQLTINNANLSDGFDRLYPVYKSPKNYQQDWETLQWLMQRAGQQLTTTVEAQIKSNTRVHAAAEQANANIDAATHSKNQMAVMQTAAKMSTAQYLAITNLSNLMAQEASVQNVYIHNLQMRDQQTHNEAQAASRFFSDGQSDLRNSGRRSQSNIDPRLYQILNVSPAIVQRGLAPNP